ncbi:MAG: TRAP transporter substrate-binding protein, partial [candidate division WOR-3 bacterium]
KGTYTIRLYPGGQLCSVPESLDAIRTGAVEAGMIPLGAFAGTVPEFGLPELPFLFNNNEANAYAMAGITELRDQLLQKKCNQKCLGCIAVGTFQLLSRKKHIKTLDDFKGLIVGCDTPPMAAAIKALGGSAIIVDFTEDYSNLQKGVIDVKTSAPQYVLVAKLYEVAKYYTVCHMFSGLYAFTINLDLYNKMPEEIKTALVQELGNTAKRISQNYVDLFYKLEPILKEKGLQYYYLPPEERNKWKEKTQAIISEAITKFGEVGIKFKKIVDEANAKYPYKLH